MEQNEQENKKKVNLPEAIHPEIGNGLAWETNPHYAALRSIDPLAVLDPYLQNDLTSFRHDVIQKWASIEGTGPESDLTVDQQVDKSEITKGRRKKIHAAQRVEDEKPDWFEQMDDSLLLKGDPNGPVEDLDIIAPDQSIEVADHGHEIEEIEETDVIPEGKRVRKAIKKAQKASKKQAALKERAESRQETLSPFTSWLKSLKGSEYVHPFDDDFALEQMSGNPKEGISETFADLLASQGFREQAIDMYMLLMAKYPGKSSFFAAKIEALK